MSKTTTTATKEDGKPGLLPKLRFPEFQNAGEWEMTELGEKVDLLSGYPFDGADITQDSTGIPLLRGINVTEGRIRHNPEIDRYYKGSTDGLEKFSLQTNDLVIGMDGSKVGKNSALVSDADSGALLIQRVARLRAKSPSLIQFIFQRIHSPEFHSYVDRINTSSGIPHISAKQIKEFQICFPTDAEQRRIAECLSSVDELIAAQTRKVDALKAHKKGLMQQLFPREGETQPRLRFPEFQNSEEWSEEKLDDLVHFQDGFAFKSTDFVKAQEDATQVIRITDINNKNTNEDKVYIPSSFLEANKLAKYSVNDGDLLLSLTGAAGFNFFFWNGGPATINQRTAKVTSKKKPCNSLLRLLEPLIHEKINERGEGQNNNLSKDFLSTIVFLVPEPDEQQRIASCQSSLDNRITAETQKLEALTTHKKGLMQQLFPSPEKIEL